MEEVNILTFNPKDGYIPMVFQKNAGSCNTLSSEYAAATDKYGYEVIQRGTSVKVTGKKITLTLERGEGAMITLL